MKVIKAIIVFICVALVLLGIVYNVLVTPFSNPKFDLIAWSAIGVAFLILAIMAKKK